MLALAKAALSFAASHWKGVLIALAFAALGLKLIAAQGDARHWHKVADRNEALYHAEQAAHALTVANYRRATAEAQAADAAHVIQVERKQASISNEVSNEYASKISSLRARYDALRVRGSSAVGVTGNRSSGDSAGMSGPAQGATGADAAADQKGLSAPDALICSIQAEQLDSLIDWEERVGRVDSR